MSLPDVLRCRFCQMPSQDRLCMECFSLRVEDELCGPAEPDEPQLVELWSPEDGIRLLASIAGANGDVFVLDRFRKRIVDAVSLYGGLDYIVGAGDLVSSGEDLFLLAVQRFDGELSEIERRRLWRGVSDAQKAVEVCAALERLVVEREREVERVLRREEREAENARLRRQVEILREEKERRDREELEQKQQREREEAEARERARPRVRRNYAEPAAGEPPGFNIIRSDPGWQALPAAWKCVFEFLFGLSRLDKEGKRFGCLAGMEWIQAGTGYGESSVSRAVKGLIKAGWIGRPKLGTIYTGVSWYWVARSPKFRKKS